MGPEMRETMAVMGKVATQNCEAIEAAVFVLKIIGSNIFDVARSGFSHD
jgi:hypothetical protein